MAKIVNNDKGFKVICMSSNEAANIKFGIIPGSCICMQCKNPISGKIYYIAALNGTMCKSCYKKWNETAIHHEYDAKQENKYFNYYSKLLGL